jgi:hypothetical protein
MVGSTYVVVRVSSYARERGRVYSLERTRCIVVVYISAE